MDDRIRGFTFTQLQPQATQTDILAAQSGLDAYCKRNGYRIVGSAFTREASVKLPAVIEHILTDMKSKEAGLLVIPNPSCLGRNAAAFEIARKFAAAGIEIETADDGCRLAEKPEQAGEPLIQRM